MHLDAVTGKGQTSITPNQPPMSQPFRFVVLRCGQRFDNGFQQAAYYPARVRGPVDKLHMFVIQPGLLSDGHISPEFIPRRVVWNCRRPCGLVGLHTHLSPEQRASSVRYRAVLIQSVVVEMKLLKIASKHS